MSRDLSFTPSAGQTLALIDSWLDDVTGWSIHDDLGSNKKVYKCDGGDVTFYVYIDDSNDTYSKINLYQYWNNEDHTGSGYSTSDRYLIKKNYTYRIVGDDTYFSIYSLVSFNNMWSVYIGYGNNILPDDNNCIFIDGDNVNNPTGSYCFYPTSYYPLFLFGYGGSGNINGYVYHISQSSNQYITVNNQGIILFNLYLGVHTVNDKIRCTYKNVFGCGNSSPSGFSVNDLAYIGNTPYIFRGINSSSTRYLFIINS